MECLRGRGRGEWDYLIFRRDRQRQQGLGFGFWSHLNPKKNKKTTSVERLENTINKSNHWSQVRAGGLCNYFMFLGS